MIKDLGHIKLCLSDGGRQFYIPTKTKRTSRDCAVRAIAHATGKEYIEVYSNLKQRQKRDPLTGTYVYASNGYMKSLGYEYTPCKGMTLKAARLPKDGIYVIQVSHHLTAYINGILFDNHDCTKNGRRQVKGYWKVA